MGKLDTSRYYGDSFLKAEDVKDKTKVTILGTKENRKPNGDERKQLCLILDGYEPVFGLNVTNLNAMIEKMGDDTDKWIGKTIVLRHAMAPNPQKGGHETKTLRIE